MWWPGSGCNQHRYFQCGLSVFSLLLIAKIHPTLKTVAHCIFKQSSGWEVRLACCHVFGNVTCLPGIEKLSWIFDVHVPFKQKKLGNKLRNPIVNNIRHSNTGSERVLTLFTVQFCSAGQSVTDLITTVLLYYPSVETLIHKIKAASIQLWRWLVTIGSQTTFAVHLISAQFLHKESLQSDMYGLWENKHWSPIKCSLWVGMQNL